MAIHLDSLQIDAFRGIKHLAVPKLNQINLVAGDNNCGKTSILEAILLLRNPMEFSNILRISRLRNQGVRWNGESVYQSFLALFPHMEPETMDLMEVSVSAQQGQRRIEYNLLGTQNTVMLDDLAVRQRITAPHRESLGELPQECLEFQGVLRYDLGDGKKNKNAVEFNEFDRIGTFGISRRSFLNIVYLSPFDHLGGNLFGQIINTERYKRLCVSMLQLFDPCIDDLLLLKETHSGRPVECVHHCQLGSMPISTYGDGIKKVLSIANGLAKAQNGILLIDEIETAIHAKYYKDIFSFIQLASQKFNVQVFITTHSLEAIDQFLELQEYDRQGDAEDISVITVKKTPDGSYSRVLTGRQVYENREQFGFEVRL